MVDDSEIVNLPFPFSAAELSPQNLTHFAHHPTVQLLSDKFALDSLCGYLVFLRTSPDPLPEPKRESSDEPSECSLRPPSDGSPAADPLPSPTSTLRSNFNNTVTKDPRRVPSRRHSLLPGESFQDYVLFDCAFGIPLFDEQLNMDVSQRLLANNLFDR